MPINLHVFRRTASQLCSFFSSGTCRLLWRTILRTRLSSQGEKFKISPRWNPPSQAIFLKNRVSLKPLLQESSEGKERGGSKASSRKAKETSAGRGEIKRISYQENDNFEKHLKKQIYYWQFSWALKDADLFSKLLSSFWDCGSVLMVGGDIPPLTFSFHFIFWSDLSIFGLSIGL